jgi:hypothetical protein
VVRIREVPGSNLYLETGYPDCWFLWFPSVSPSKYWYSTLKYTTASFLDRPNSSFTVVLPFLTVIFTDPTTWCCILHGSYHLMLHSSRIIPLDAAFFTDHTTWCCILHGSYHLMLHSSWIIPLDAAFFMDPTTWWCILHGSYHLMLHYSRILPLDAAFFTNS